MDKNENLPDSSAIALSTIMGTDNKIPVAVQQLTEA
jgi:hypothetical protein